MYKLILHHVYRSSAPFLDLSGHGTHAQGTNVGWSADGAVPQSGAAVFNGSTSPALVPISPSGKISTRYGSTRWCASIRCRARPAIRYG